MHSPTEENYLKAIYGLQESTDERIPTNAIARKLSTSAASVTDMLKRLHSKKLIRYAPYKGVSLTPNGKKTALRIIRKHRLWEYFLVHKLGFGWEEVHEIAEQLEHVRSELLTEKLNTFLGDPRFDPHGDPIPDRNGRFSEVAVIPLSDVTVPGNAVLSAVTDHRPVFLQFITGSGLSIGSRIRISRIYEHDRSMDIHIGKDKRSQRISRDTAAHLMVSLS